MQCRPRHRNHCGHHSSKRSALLCHHLRFTLVQAQRVPQEALRLCSSWPGVQHLAGNLTEVPPAALPSHLSIVIYTFFGMCKEDKNSITGTKHTPSAALDCHAPRWSVLPACQGCDDEQLRVPQFAAAVAAPGSDDLLDAVHGAAVADKPWMVPQSAVLLARPHAYAGISHWPLSAWRPACKRPVHRCCLAPLQDVEHGCCMEGLDQLGEPALIWN